MPICKKCEKYRDMLFSVVDALDLSESAIQQHGPNGTPPAELVRLVLAEKDKKIALLKRGIIVIEAKDDG